jgi:ribosomal-protein-serine acetyltransferase
MTLQVSEDIELRPVVEEDAKPMFALVDANRAYLRQWLPWLDGNTEVEHTRGFIKLSIEQREQNLGMACGIWFRRELCGVIGFHKIDWMNKNVELGYWIEENSQGKGIVTRSCQRMIDYAFDEWKLHRVQIRCATENPKSCAIIERLELKFEGVARGAEFLYDRYVDLNVYAIRDFEWRLIQKRKLERTVEID